MTQNSLFNAKSAEWKRVRELEDILAALARIDERRKVIRLHAWQRADWDVVYNEATKMLEDLDRVRDELGAHWRQFYSFATGIPEHELMEELQYDRQRA